MGDQTSRYKRFGGGGGAHRNASQTKKIIHCGYKDEEEIASMEDGNGNSAFGEGEERRRRDRSFRKREREIVRRI